MAMSAQTLVYGTIDDALVFIDRDLAQELALLRTGIGTWGQARELLPPRRWQDIVERLEGWEKEPPASAEPFDLSQIPGYDDGDWPEWPAQLMLDWMPPELIARFGRSTASVLNGDFLDIAAQHEAALVTVLEGAGWTCIKDNALVRTASGYDPGDRDTEPDVDRPGL
jgi:hypothetical protein